MTYVSLDDALTEDDRVLGLTDKAFRLHVTAWCAAGRNLTDGVILETRLPTLRAQTQATQKHVNELVEQGLWRPVHRGETFEIEGKNGPVSVVVMGRGYYLECYLELNRSKGQVDALIEARREAGRLGGIAKAKASAVANALAKTYPDTDTEATASPVRRKGAGAGDEIAADVIPWDRA